MELESVRGVFGLLEAISIQEINLLKGIDGSPFFGYFKLLVYIGRYSNYVLSAVT